MQKHQERSTGNSFTDHVNWLTSNHARLKPIIIHGSCFMRCDWSIACR